MLDGFICFVWDIFDVDVVYVVIDVEVVDMNDLMVIWKVIVGVLNVVCKFGNIVIVVVFVECLFDVCLVICVYMFLMDNLVKIVLYVVKIKLYKNGILIEVEKLSVLVVGGYGCGEMVL